MNQFKVYLLHDSVISYSVDLDILKPMRVAPSDYSSI